MRKDPARFNLVAAFLFGLLLASAFFLFTQKFFLQPRAECLQGTVQTVFSPNADADILFFLSSAQHSVDVELYQFSYSPLKAALVEAVERGARVRLILEPRVDSNLETASFLAGKGVLVRWASRDYTNTHSKYAVVDGRAVLVGSTNWSNRGMTSNREAGVVINDEATAQSFLREFEEDWAMASEVAA